MTREEAIKHLKQFQDCGDTEIAHTEVDSIICDLLIDLGYLDVVEEWVKVPKWYA